MFLSGGIASVAAVSVIVVLCVLTFVAASWAVVNSFFKRFVEVLVNVLPLLF